MFYDSIRMFRPDEFPITRYTTANEAEKENLWSRVWQYACRADEIPEVGDYYVYEIVGRSYVVMRSSDDEIKAYPNAATPRLSTEGLRWSMLGDPMPISRLRMGA